MTSSPSDQPPAVPVMKPARRSGSVDCSRSQRTELLPPSASLAGARLPLFAPVETHHGVALALRGTLSGRSADSASRTTSRRFSTILFARGLASSRYPAMVTAQAGDTGEPLLRISIVG